MTNLHLTHHLVCLPMLIVAKFCLRKNDHELMEVRYYCLYAILLLRSDACYQLIMSWLFIVFHCISLCCCRHFASLSPPLHTCDSDLFCLTFDVTSITTMCTPFSVVNFSSEKKNTWFRKLRLWQKKKKKKNCNSSFGYLTLDRKLSVVTSSCNWSTRF